MELPYFLKHKKNLSREEFRFEFSPIGWCKLKVYFRLNHPFAIVTRYSRIVSLVLPEPVIYSMHFQEEKYMHICKAYKSANFTFPFSPQFRSLFRKILLVTSAKRPVKHTIQGERKINPKCFA